MKKTIVNSLLFVLAIVFSFSSLFLSTSFLSFSSDANIAYATSQILAAKRDDVYNRVIVQCEGNVSYKGYVELERQFLKKMYMKGHVFSLTQTAFDSAPDETINVAEFDVNPKGKVNYLYQDIKFVSGCELKNPQENSAVISDALAATLAASFGYGENLSRLISESKEIELFGQRFVVSGVYISGHRYRCTNYLYSTFGETVLINSEKLLSLADEFVPLEHRYYMSLGANYRININEITAMRTLFSGLSYPDVSVNAKFFEKQSYQEFMRAYFNENIAGLIVVGILMLLVGLGALLASVALSWQGSENKVSWIVSAAASLLVPFLVLVLFAKGLPLGLFAFGKSILMINKAGIIAFVVAYFLLFGTSLLAKKLKKIHLDGEDLTYEDRLEMKKITIKGKRDDR